LENHIHSRINSLAQELSISSKYVVYVLECGRSVLSGERKEFGRKFYQQSDNYDQPKYVDNSTSEDGSVESEIKKRLPGWFNNIELADSIYYVGYTKNLPKRLFDHIYPTKDGALFTKIFEPNALVAVKGYDDHQKAKKRESQIAHTLDDYRIYDIQPPKRLQGLDGDRKRIKKHSIRTFEGSDKECMMDVLLNSRISDPLSGVDDASNYREVYRRVQHKHLNECLEYCMEQNCYCHISDVNERLDKVLDQIRSFYFGAYLYYRGMIRRIKSEQIYGNYSM
jgi:predicted GIY-YIG superfamily endonuclease